MRTLRTELRRGRKLAPTVRASRRQRGRAFLTELRARSIRVLAPGTLHRGASSESGRASGQDDTSPLGRRRQRAFLGGGLNQRSSGWKPNEALIRVVTSRFSLVGDCRRISDQSCPRGRAFPVVEEFPGTASSRLV